MDQGREGANHPVGLVNASDSSINMEPSSDRKVDPTRSERPAPRLGQAAAAAAGSRSSSGSFSSRVQPSLATKHNSEWNLQETIPTVRSERKCCFCCGHRWVFVGELRRHALLVVANTGSVVCVCCCLCGWPPAQADHLGQTEHGLSLMTQPPHVLLAS